MGVGVGVGAGTGAGAGLGGGAGAGTGVDPGDGVGTGSSIGVHALRSNAVMLISAITVIVITFIISTPSYLVSFFLIQFNRCQVVISLCFFL